jgi:Ser/Thr protein kinase RdoA (MazF antagonist)
VIFRAGQLAHVTGFELADGRAIVVKVRPYESRHAACAAVQASLAAAGFPCPVPLAGPEQLDEYAITAETFLPGGDQLPSGCDAAPFAALLASLVRSAPAVVDVPPLAPSPPWAGWDHGGARLWPDRDDHGRDLNDLAGPGWIDDAGRRVRGYLRRHAGPVRIGHGDFESQNIRWCSAEPVAVHDWDSVIAQPETAIAGLAAAVWPARGSPGQAATPSQTADFLAAYQRAAGLCWTEPELRHAWAAGLWVRLFNARKDAADGGGPQLDRLAIEITERLSRAGLDHDRQSL